MSKKFLITGAAGFIASHFIEHILKLTDHTIVGLDRLDETSTLARIGDTDAFKQNRDRFKFVWHDLKAPINEFTSKEIGEDIDVILHLAASTHVDRSISDPMAFIYDNVVGTGHLLEFARKYHSSARFLYGSSDEVFGPAEKGTAFKEWDRYKSSNPYSAAKAGGEELVYAYHNTYKLDTLVTHCVNVLGERQAIEKYLPLIIRKIILGEEILIHANEDCTIPTSRFYIHARNVAAAMLHILEYGLTGEKYNIGGQEEIDSLDLAQRVAVILNKPLKHKIVNSVSNRPGHDSRYALDCSRLFDELKFSYPKTFSESLHKTVLWYYNNPKWLGI